MNEELGHQLLKDGYLFRYVTSGVRLPDNNNPDSVREVSVLIGPDELRVQYRVRHYCPVTGNGRGSSHYGPFLFDTSEEVLEHFRSIGWEASLLQIEPLTEWDDGWPPNTKFWQPVEQFDLEGTDSPFRWKEKFLETVQKEYDSDEERLVYGPTGTLVGYGHTSWSLKEELGDEEAPIGPTTVVANKVLHHCKLTTIMNELGEKAVLPLHAVWKMMERQGRGEAGILPTNEKDFHAFVRGKKEEIVEFFAYWGTHKPLNPDTESKARGHYGWVLMARKAHFGDILDLEPGTIVLSRG